MIYTKKTVERALADRNLRGQQAALCEDWLELHANLQRLRDAACAVLDRWEEEEWEHEEEMGMAFDNLRIAAGVKAPPQDGDAGDRADEGYARNVNP